MLNPADPWRSLLYLVLATELVGGVWVGATLWSVWNLDMGDEWSAQVASWEAGPWWLAAGVAVGAVVWTAALVLTMRRAGIARLLVGLIAVLHVVAAVAVPWVATTVAGSVFAVAGLIACAAFIATVAVFPEETG